jgi:chorismate lyase/3-hydroxybenzoate synthase
MDMVVSPVALKCCYYDILDEQEAHTALACFRFDARCANTANSRRLSTGLLPLDGNIIGELFAGAGGTFSCGYGAHSYWAETDEYMLLALWSDETDEAGLAAVTERLYSELLEQTNERGYPHLVRVWNYFADINGEEQGLERYRQFCLGRFEAFAAAGIAENQYPSACALGHHGGDLLVYALASKVVPYHFENPRQASAYRYPAEYGPRSPSFARASLLSLPGQMPKLFVSGTASVVGHITLHPYRLGEQISVTLENLDLLLAHVARQYAGEGGELPQLQAEVLKVYVRNPADFAEIKARVEQVYPQVPVVYVAADICRADLLLEIDGIWNLLV